MFLLSGLYFDQCWWYIKDKSLSDLCHQAIKPDNMLKIGLCYQAITLAKSDDILKITTCYLANILINTNDKFDNITKIRLVEPN